ncbi:MAG: hypothetical protein ACI9FN_000477 [Saprospiraceae bacterium]|jgi:uncharacterized protein (DUF1800 family)
MPTVRPVFLLLLFFSYSAHAQIYDDYFGNGHTIGVKVTSSSDELPDSSFYSIDGSNIIPDLAGAARFLSNATLGTDYEEIERVSQIGINPWIDEQMALPTDSFYLDLYKKIYFDIIEERHNVVTSAIPIDSVRRQEILGFAFYEKLFSKPDILRQRVAMALSQIFVITRSANFILNRGFGISDYYDLLYKDSFGNFRDLLEDVTMHPIMGVYLSHLQNEKADTSAGVFPDENYAREIMQLFTIGLLQLNMDGTVKLDAHGKSTPTYDIEDVQELAKVFTGLSGGAYDPESISSQIGLPLIFNRSKNQFDYTVPMAMYDEFHEQGIKILTTGDTIEAGQTGMQDISDVIDILFNHDNVAPFIAKRMIQHLVKSNPTPAYVNRVALTFGDNGSGERGDIGAVVRAILIDPEAIDCNWIEEAAGGKLIQPLERFINLYLAFDIQSPSNKFYFRDKPLLDGRVEQSFLNAQSVFNFFTPFYAETNFVAPEDLVSPEFQILHSISSINYLNLIENSIKRKPFNNFTAVNPLIGNSVVNTDDEPFLDFSDELALYESAGGIQALLDRLDILLCRGQLSQSTKDIIANTITQYESNIGSYTSKRAVEDALYFVMASPDYIIQK